MNYLCVDYGLKHVGLAIATTPLAEPIATVPASQAVDRIAQLITDHQITQLVIGLSENQMAEKTRAFAGELARIFNLPVNFHDETLSSQETRQKMAQSGLKKSKREQKIDHLVAAAIIQDYLDILS
jgi:putative transcription antitermination factor YqgF